MDSIISKFEKTVGSFIDARGLLHRQAPVIVALSGGADSVALLAALSRLGYDCRAAHCNFHLRGEESMRDMRHAQTIAEKLDVDLYVRDFDVEARRRNTGESVEMAARELRYAWFAELLDRDGAQAVAVGHHREDRVETFFLNLFRSTGIAGLTSMQPRSGSVVRPLLELSRADIEAYLKALGLKWVDDSSNASDAHRRNRLRNTILPQIEESFPGAVNAVLATIGRLEDTEAIFRDALEKKRLDYSTPTGYRLQSLVEAEAQPHIMLFEWLKPLGFSATQVADMLASANGSGQKFYSPDGRVLAEINRGQLDLSDAAGAASAAIGCFTVNPRHDIDSPIRIAVSRGRIENFVAERLGPSVAYFDAAIADTDARWELRHPRRGDRMIPFGQHSSKLLSDIFAAAKYTAAQKREQWVLTIDGEIAWLPGLRNSALHAVGPGTKSFLRLQLK